jgi:hypothetical protein
MARSVLAAAVAWGCVGYEGPPCDEIDTRGLTVDASGRVPVATFEGARPNYATVFEGDVGSTAESEFDFFEGDPVWQVDCACHDRTGEFGCRDNLDQELRACVRSPLTYGEGGSPNAVPTVRPAPLRSGEVYSLVVGSYCRGERIQDDAVNGGDPFHVNHVESLAVFTAP